MEEYLDRRMCEVGCRVLSQENSKKCTCLWGVLCNKPPPPRQCQRQEECRGMWALCLVLVYLGSAWLHCFYGGTKHSVQETLCINQCDCHTVLTLCSPTAQGPKQTGGACWWRQTAVPPSGRPCPFLYSWVCQGGQEGQVYTNACRIPLLRVVLMTFSWG